MKKLLYLLLMFGLQLASLYAGDYVYYLQHGHSIMHPKESK